MGERVVPCVHCTLWPGGLESGEGVAREHDPPVPKLDASVAVDAGRALSSDIASSASAILSAVTPLKCAWRSPRRRKTRKSSTSKTSSLASFSRVESMILSWMRALVRSHCVSSSTVSIGVCGAVQHDPDRAGTAEAAGARTAASREASALSARLFTRATDGVVSNGVVQDRREARPGAPHHRTSADYEDCFADLLCELEPDEFGAHAGGGGY